MELPRMKVTRKSGKECFQGMGGEHSLQDFWAWAFSDLVSNTERADELVFAQGLAESREMAKRLIMAGKVALPTPVRWLPSCGSTSGPSA